MSAVNYKKYKIYSILRENSPARLLPHFPLERFPFQIPHFPFRTPHSRFNGCSERILEDLQHCSQASAELPCLSLVIVFCRGNRLFQQA